MFTLVVGAYAVYALRRPEGIPALIDKWTEVRTLEQSNQRLRLEIDGKKDRIRALKEKESELEIEMRRELQHLKKDEKMLIIDSDGQTTAAEPETPPR